jgi:hypothetical protein
LRQRLILRFGKERWGFAEEAGKHVAGKMLPDGGQVAVLEGLPKSTMAITPDNARSMMGN